MRTAIFIIVLSLFTPINAWAWDFTAPCQNAIDELNSFLASAPNSCQSLDECESAYITGHSCFGSVAMAKATLANTEFNKELLQFQSAVTATCAQEWQEQPLPACAPMPMPIDCYNSRCIDARERSD